MKIHKDLTQEHWNKYSLSCQLGNAGSEIERIINWRDKGNLDYSHGSFRAALELIDATIADPKNNSILSELTEMREGVIDHFQGDNVRNTTDQYWVDYFMIWAIRNSFERHIVYRAIIFRRQLQTSPQTPQST